MVKSFLLVLCLVAGCSTKANPNACCVSAEDCTQAGLGVVTACGQGLTCVNNQCLQETCATAGCTAAAPVCSAVTNACEGCTDSSQCASYSAQSVCDTSSGACVGCVMDTDCPVDKPVCDTTSCRACAIDADCASGGCADDGQCLAETDLIYVDNGAGVDAGQCTRVAPCASLQFAIGVASPTRSHIVLAPGLFDLGTVDIGSGQTTATAINIHGGGAMLRQRPSNDGDLFYISDVPTTIHDVTLLGNGLAGAAVESTTASVTVYRTKFDTAGSRGILAGADLIAHDVEIANASIAIQLAASNSTLTLDRAVIHGGGNGIKAVAANTRVMVSNTLVFDTQSTGMDLSNAGGRVSFTTVADAGVENGLQPVAIACSSGLGLTIAASIVWTPQAPNSASIGAGCGLNSVIAGPLSIAGAMNVDPGFVDETHRDYHLATGSPARDVLDTGPATDFEGDPRPEGPKFDLGADEAR